MRGWNFFPEKNKQSVDHFDELTVLLNLLNQGKDVVASNEWYENMPEVRPMQQKTIGFFCGDLPNMPCTVPNFYEDLPAFSFRNLELKYDVTAKSWLDQSSTITIESLQSSDVWIIAAGYFEKSFCMDGMISREPGFSVYGCRTFLFSKYIMPQEKIYID